jgi:hypothetical protein
MVWISVTTSPIFCAAAARPSTDWLVRRACSTAPCAMADECATWPPSSAIDAASSSAAAVIVWTLALVSLATARTAELRAAVSPARSAIDREATAGRARSRFA